MPAPLKVGIIGASPHGSWGTFAHLPALAALENVKAVAVATSRMQTAQETAAKFGLAHAFDDPRRLAEHSDVDAVAICVRVPAHRELVGIALNAGKHVYCEWPLGRDTEEARRLQQQAESAGVLAMVGLQARHSPALTYVRDLIAEGAIGTPRSAALTHSSDWVSQIPSALAYLQDRSSGAHFLSIPGGHSIDALCWLLGEFETLTAVVKTTTPDLIMLDGVPVTRTSADQILVAGVLASGIVASVRLSGAASPGTGVWLEINGDRGDLVISVSPGERGLQMSSLRVQKTSGMGTFEDLPVPRPLLRRARSDSPGASAQRGRSVAEVCRGDRGARPGAAKFRGCACAPWHPRLG